MTAVHQVENAPRLVVIRPSRLRGTVYALTGARVVVGRERGCELQFDDAMVSRTHAALERSGGETLVTDLGSSNGTRVNGDPVGATRRRLHPGDVVGFGEVELRFQLPEVEGDSANGTVHPEGPHYAEYRVESQAAGQLNNVAHDQYNAYIQQVREERDGFARDIASTKTKASRLIWVGFALIVLGGGTYAWALLRFAGQVDGLSIDDPEAFQPPRLFGPKLGGVPVGVIGFAVAGIGSVLLIVGVVLHIVAAARRRRLEAPAPMSLAGRPALAMAGLTTTRGRGMTFHIGSQEAHVINNVAGDQWSQGTLSDDDARDKVEQLRHALDVSGLPPALHRQVRAELDQAQLEIGNGPAHKPMVADRLKRLTEVLASAGALATAGGALLGPLGALAGWLGGLGKPIVDILRRRDFPHDARSVAIATLRSPSVRRFAADRPGASRAPGSR